MIWRKANTFVKTEKLRRLVYIANIRAGPN